MIIYTEHFREMLRERKISEKWAEETMSSPDQIYENEDGTTHYIKQIVENDNRWLRVIVNKLTLPHKVVTVFFDRRLSKEYENKGR